MKRDARIARAELSRDLVWALLWRLDQRSSPDEGWVTGARVYALWRDGRDRCGIALASDWIGPRPHFSVLLNRLVADGRAERRKLAGKHPTYRVIHADA